MTGAGGGASNMPGAGAYDYDNEMVNLSADLVIDAGKTLRVGPGTTFKLSGAMVKVIVRGTLIVEGSKDAQVQFIGTTTPRSWFGIVVESGGVLNMKYAHVGGALYGVHALPGSDFTIDYSVFDTSFKAIVAESDGSVDHTKVSAGVDPAAPLFSAVSEVSLTDVNGTLTIINASPTISNSSFMGANALVDMIRVGGNSKPILDHLKIASAHCGIHANGGTNNTPVVTNSVFTQLSYGLMVYATKPQLENNVFMMNGNDIGFCVGAAADNAPIMTNNYYASGNAIIDPSCVQIGTSEAKPAGSANPTAGPVGL
jgi:hypothetical protein